MDGEVSRSPRDSLPLARDARPLCAVAEGIARHDHADHLRGRLVLLQPPPPCFGPAEDWAAEHNMVAASMTIMIIWSMLPRTFKKTPSRYESASTGYVAES